MEHFKMTLKGNAENLQKVLDVVCGNSSRGFRGITIESIQKISDTKMPRFEIIGVCSDSIELSMCIFGKTSLREESEWHSIDIDVQSLEEDCWDDGHFHFRNGHILAYPQIDYEEAYGIKVYDYPMCDCVED